jgi:hypothetical protein
MTSSDGDGFETNFENGVPNGSGYWLTAATWVNGKQIK